MVNALNPLSKKDSQTADQQEASGNHDRALISTAPGAAVVGNVQLLDANGVQVGTYSTIQAAINAAGPDHSIVVGSGVYEEQLTVDGKTGLTIRAATGADVTVLAPDNLLVNGNSDYYGIAVRAVIAVTDSSDVRIEDIKVDGGYSGDTSPGSNGDELSGVAFLNSSGGLDGVAIDNSGNSPAGGLFGLQHGSGLFIDNSGLALGNDVSVTGSTITDFQKTGALIIGADITFTGNTITGIGATGVTAQNGIQITLSQGNLDDNIISGIGYAVPIGGTYYNASGIIAYEPSGPLGFDGNTITGVGPAGEFTALDLSDTEGVAVGFTNNIIADATNGIVAYTYVGGTTGLDTQPDFTGTTFAGITGNGVHFDPEMSYGAPFSTATGFTVTGSDFADLLAGSDGNDSFNGGGGVDRLTGREGDDSLAGGGGTDTAAYAGVIADYTIAYQTDSAGRVTGFTAVTDDNDGNGDEGADTLTSIERLEFDNATFDANQKVQLFDGGDNLVSTHDTIQAAVDASSAGYTIRVAAGTFTENVNFHTAVTVLGAHAGDAGSTRVGADAAGETTLIGRHDITAATGAVVLDGLRFVSNSATTNGGVSDPILQIVTGGGHEVTNSVFYSEVAGGARPSPDDRAISMPVIADGTITISDNYFTGASTGGFSTASWGRAIWFDGGGVDLAVTGNTIEYSRTGLNMDMSGDSQASVSGNLFTTTGTAMAVGVDLVGLTVTDNDFSNAGEEFNFRNQTLDVTFDAETAVDAQSGSFVDVLGGSGNDHLSGTSYSDLLDGNQLSPANPDNDTLDGRGGADVLLGRAGNDILIGGDGNDLIDVGVGLDTAQFTGALSFADTFVGWVVTSGEGTDFLQNTEIAVAGSGQRTLLVGATGFAGVQAAFDNAQNGDHVRLASGTYTGTYTFTDTGLTVFGMSATINATFASAAIGISVFAGGNNDSITTSGGNDVLHGGGGNDTLFGAGGNDSLTGGTGVDAMHGGAGDDFYFVDTAGDSATETAGQGFDVVWASASYALAAGTDIEALSARMWEDTTSIALTGNEISNNIYGNAGANKLDGGGGNDVLFGFEGNDFLTGGTGADLMYGGAGNDFYFVDTAADNVVESAGQGFDVVWTTASYTLAPNSDVEALSSRFWEDTNALDLTGNGIANALFGNAGANVLDGGGGNDRLQGFGGADTFAFTTALGAGNADTIADFSAADDTIALDDAVFAGLTLGALNPNAFVTGTAALDADDRIIYNSATGALYFDADGSGSGAAVQFATLQGAPIITASDFMVI